MQNAFETYVKPYIGAVVVTLIVMFAVKKIDALKMFRP